MSYTVQNFKTKKSLKEAISQYHERQTNPETYKGTLYGVSQKCYQPGLGPDLSDYTGKVSLEGPHYPKAHTWYAVGEMVNGILVKVS